MKKLVVNAVMAASASFLVVAPAAAQDVLVEIPYSDLDIATPEGAAVLAQRVKSACERPDIRVLRAMASWEQCKTAALDSAVEQLTRDGAELETEPFAAN